jgi:hypothetical protein
MKLKTTLLVLFFTNLSFAQTPVDVADLTLKVKANSSEEFFYGFAEGDQIVFSFSEVDGKELKEVEISEYPENSKFLGYETAKIDKKTINVVEKGVYKFRFKNNHILKGRVCQIKIQRIPASEASKNFNTNVKWITEQDTTWNVYTKDFVIGYDTLFVPKTRKVIDKEEKLEEIIMDKAQRVHSQTNINGNKTFVSFSLPDNLITEFETKKVVAWAYWVGVGEESNRAWQQNKTALASGIGKAASMVLTPLGGLAVGVLSNLALPNIGEDVSYGLVDETNKNYFMSGIQYQAFDSGKGVGGSKRFVEPRLCQGRYYIVLHNDNIMQGIDANIKVSAIVERKLYKKENYTEIQSNPRYEKRVVRDPIIKTQKFPATFDYKKK